MDIYRERAHLLGYLSTIHESHLYVPEDHSPGYGHAVCIHFPWNQASWHIADSDLDLFAHLPITDSHYDGHTTEEKYAAMARTPWILKVR